MQTPLEDRAGAVEAIGYQKPALERLGSFREMTRSGGLSFSDQWMTDGSGCQLNGSRSYTCVQP